MARKRSYEEIDEISALDRPITSTKLHGAVTSLSPIKKGRNSIFFDGTLADEKSKIRFVGFDAHQQRKLDEYHQRNVPVELANCEVKSSRFGDGYELLLKSATGIKESPKKMNVSALMQEMVVDTPTTIELGGISHTDLFQKVTVSVKVLDVKEVERAGDKQKQDVIVGDSSGTAKVTLWGENVDKLTNGECYQLQNFIIREFQALRYLSMTRAADVTRIEDIGDVAQQVDMEETLTLQNVMVVGVPHIDVYKCCLGCRARVEPLTPPLARCSGCQMTQRSDICREVMSAKLLVMYERDGKNRMMQCYAYDDILREMAGDQDISQESLLNAPRYESIVSMREKKQSRK